MQDCTKDRPRSKLIGGAVRNLSKIAFATRATSMPFPKLKEYYELEICMHRELNSLSDIVTSTDSDNHLLATTIAADPLFSLKDDRILRSRLSLGPNGKD